MAPMVAVTPPNSHPPGLGTRVFARSDGSVAQSASPSPAPSATASATPGPVPASSPSPELLARARTEFLAWQSGTIDTARYTPAARAQFTPALVKTVSGSVLGGIGTLQSITQLQKTTMQGAQIYVYRVVGDKQTTQMIVSWNDAGLVQFLRFTQPTPTAPS